MGKTLWEKATDAKNVFVLSVGVFDKSVTESAPTETLAANADSVAKSAAKLARALRKIDATEKAITERKGF